MDLITNNIHDENFKGAIELYYPQLYYVVNATKGRILQRIFKDRLYSEMSVMMFPPNHKLFEPINRKMQQLFEAGSIEHYFERSKDKLDPKRYEHLYETTAQVLTMKHLSAGFIIWTFSLVLAIAAFIVEWIVTIIKLLVVKFIFAVFFKMNLS